MNFELVLSIDYCSCMCYRTLSLIQYSAYLCVIHITSSVIAFYCQYVKDFQQTCIGGAQFCWRLW